MSPRQGHRPCCNCIGTPELSIAPQSAAKVCDICCPYSNSLPCCSSTAHWCARHCCTHGSAAGAGYAGTAARAAGAAAASRREDRIRRRFPGGSNLLGLGLEQQRRLLGSAPAEASLGGGALGGTQEAQRRQLHSNSVGYHGGPVAGAVANKQPRFGDPVLRCRCVLPRGDVFCVMSLGRAYQTSKDNDVNCFHWNVHESTQLLRSMSLKFFNGIGLAVGFS